jgi:hypothetical protein
MIALICEHDLLLVVISGSSFIDLDYNLCSQSLTAGDQPLGSFASWWFVYRNYAILTSVTYCTFPVPDMIYMRTLKLMKAK